MTKPGKEVDANKVIDRLMQKIAALTYENTVLAAALAEYEEATAATGNGPVPEEVKVGGTD